MLLIKQNQYKPACDIVNGTCGVSTVCLEVPEMQIKKIISTENCIKCCILLYILNIMYVHVSMNYLQLVCRYNHQ